MLRTSRISISLPADPFHFSLRYDSSSIPTIKDLKYSKHVPIKKYSDIIQISG